MYRILLLVVGLGLSPAMAATISEIDAAIASGNGEEAFELASEGPPWHLAYVQANALVFGGRPDKAIPMARKLVEDQPDDIRVRHLLMNALLADRQGRAAAWHARKNLAAGLPPAMEAQYRDLLEQYRDEVPAGGVSLSFGMEPSSNVNDGSSDEIIFVNGSAFTISDDSRAQSGGTVTVGVTGYRHFLISETADAVLSATVDVERPYSGPGETEVSLRPSLQFRERVGKASVGLGPTSEIKWQDGKLALKQIGFAGSLTRTLGARSAIQFSGQQATRDYEGRDYLDGSISTVELSFSRKLTPSLKASMGIDFARERTEAAHLTNDETGVSLGFENVWGNGILVDAEIFYREADYEGNFPGLDYAREDSTRGLQIGGSYREFEVFGGHPYLGVRYEEQESNIGLYDYEATDLIISMRRSF